MKNPEYTVTFMLYLHEHFETHEPAQLDIVSAEGHLEVDFLNYLQENSEDVDILNDLLVLPTETWVDVTISYRWVPDDEYSYWDWELLRWEETPVFEGVNE